MLEHVIAGHRIIGAAHGPGKTGAARGERGEAHMLQQAGAADIPWIGEHETALLVQSAERGAFVGDRAGHR
jgi:hypothetical protein